MNTDWAPELQKARVYEQILLDVIVGDLAPGAVLDEKLLARRYAAGLSGVREALGRLALEGLVIRRPRSGTTVSPLDFVEMRQAFEAKRLIEPHCAALAARHANVRDIEALRAAFDGAPVAIETGDYRALVGMDQRFGAALARASGNALLARIVMPLQHASARFWVYSMSGASADENLAQITRHAEVVDSIAAGDAEGARVSMMALLGMSGDDLRRAVSAPHPAHTNISEDR